MFRTHPGRVTFTSSAEKLACHVDRLHEFKRDGVLRAVTLDVAPTNRCNLNCGFCSVKNRDRTTDLPYWQACECLLSYIDRGLLSVELTGGGEPTAWPHFERFVRFVRDLGCVKMALITNGFNLARVAGVLDAFEWARVSLNGWVDAYNDRPMEFDLVPDGVLLSFNYVWHTGSDAGTIARLLKIIDMYPRARMVKVQLDVFDADVEIEARRLFANIDDPRVFLTDKANERVPETCYFHALKPHLHADGNIYACSTCCLPTRRFPPTHVVGRWDELPPLRPAPFDTDLCERCFFGPQCDLLEIIKNGVEHHEFL